jgi:hypothetical protein
MIDEIVATLGQEGYVMLPDAVGSGEIARAKTDLEAILERVPTGRDDFEGRRTRRVYALFAKTRSLDNLAMHPQVLDVLDRVLGHYQLSAPAAIAIGATRVVPGSHRWVDARPEPATPTVAVEMSAGSALVYLGSVWHGGGANRTDKPRLGVVLHYAAGWLRPVESHLLAVPPDIARSLPERLQELLGYNIYPPFIGYVDGRHPRKQLTAPVGGGNA